MAEKISILFETTQGQVDIYDLELYKSTEYVEENIIEITRQKPDAWYKHEYFQIDTVIQFIQSKRSDMKVSMHLN
jgi:hypothetical protein